MPRIFDNIDLHLGEALQRILTNSFRADICVGYFNLRGWDRLATQVGDFAAEEGKACRLIVGMQLDARAAVRNLYSVGHEDHFPTNEELLAKKVQVAEEFRLQLTIGAPTNRDEATLRLLAEQLRARKLRIKVFLSHPLHAKLYLCFRQDHEAPVVGFVGSSNLTFAGLKNQGELNVDVLEQDAAQKLATWFEARWEDLGCVDISDELASIIEESWAREDQPSPFYVYLKIAYHLSQEARFGLAGFSIPTVFKGELLSFQEEAVRIAAQNLNRHKIALLGDVVGLGKTRMACALAKIYEELGNDTLIICPVRLKRMWEDHVHRYQLRAHVMPLTMAAKELGDFRPYRLVLIDESHNLRNSEGKTYQAIKKYIGQVGSRLILLSATPYNKSYADLVGQLGLKLDLSEPLTIKPERLLEQLTAEQKAKLLSQYPANSLGAFSASEHAEDWQELLRQMMTRRTRSFIKKHYAPKGEDGRHYLTSSDGTLLALPERLPKAVRFKVDAEDPNDQYARLFSDDVVDTLNRLHLSRYGLGDYVVDDRLSTANALEREIVKNLKRARRRLVGFCRTNLLKRLESSGHCFLLSVRRHLLRNYLFLHALENGLPIPIGSLDTGSMDTLVTDEDRDEIEPEVLDLDEASEVGHETDTLAEANNLKLAAARLYDEYQKKKGKRYQWFSSTLLHDTIVEHLQADCLALESLLNDAGEWNPGTDEKVEKLCRLLDKHATDKLLVFTQFSDTAVYLEGQLRLRGYDSVVAVTGTMPQTEAVYRFSPKSNQKKVPANEQIRVLISTDVLSEGQNLQDCAIVVNFDLPWTLIRLIQRAGRVDRIAQEAPTVICYTFLPAKGVEKHIKLRAKVRQRLKTNSEVLGSDELFGFEKEEAAALQDLYTEKSGTLDPDESDEEVDLTSRAWEIWQTAIKENPKLEKLVAELPDVVYSTKANDTEGQRDGSIVYVRTAEGTDALAFVDDSGDCVTEFPSRILKLAQCEPDAKAVHRLERHHELVNIGAEHLSRTALSQAGQLGPPSHPRHKAYNLLEKLSAKRQSTLFGVQLEEIRAAMEAVHDYPLQSDAGEQLRRQFRYKASEASMAEMLILMHRDGKLVVEPHEQRDGELKIICSLGLRSEGK